MKTQFHYNGFVYWAIFVYFPLKYCLKHRSSRFNTNTEGRRLSNYSIKLILCSHYRSRCKGLCQDEKREFDQYTKGGHFCAAHMALRREAVAKLFYLLLDEEQRWSSGQVLGLRSKRTGVRFPASPLEFPRLVISCFQVAIWLKYRWSDVNPQYNQQPTNLLDEI